MVIGVLPRAFDFPTPSVDIFYPAPTSVRSPIDRLARLSVIGRLRDGVSLSAAEAELNGLVPRLAERFPEITPELLRRSRARVSVEALKAATVAPVRAQLVLLGALVAVVLLIATTNVCNLFLLRTERASRRSPSPSRSAPRAWRLPSASSSRGSCWASRRRPSRSPRPLSLCPRSSVSPSGKSRACTKCPSRGRRPRWCSPVRC